MQAKIRIGLIFGGRSGEHAVSLMSAQSVLQALDAGKYAVTQIGITRQGEWLTGENLLEAMQAGDPGHFDRAVLLPVRSAAGSAQLYRLQALRLEPVSQLDVLFPVLHGTFGEDGTMQGFFELAEVAYVGAGVLGSSVAMDKALFKDVMRANQIPVLESILVLRSDIQADMDAVIRRAEALAAYPLFTKPANLGSSVGIMKCYQRSDLVEGLLEAAQYDRRILIERGIEAREIEVSVLGNEYPQASVAGEIRPAGDFYTYESKYHDDRSELLIPAALPDELAQELRQIAVRSYQAIDGAGMARVDFLLDRHTQELYLNEINTIPGFTQISMYSKLWEATGLPYPQLVDRLVELAFERQKDRAETVREFNRPE